MEEALKKKDHDLAEAQKVASDETKLAEEKLAPVGNLEEENSTLKTALNAANQEVSRLKNDKIALGDKASELVRRRNDLEAYLGGLVKKLFVMLEGNHSYPTDLLSSTQCRSTDLSLNCVFRILPELRGGNQSGGDKFGPH